MSKQSSENNTFNGVLNLYKQPGETPLERLKRLREEHPEYKEAVLTYLGRLDPLAEGVLLVGVNEENKNRHTYLGLPKEYEVTVLCGASTDTHDVLGLMHDAAEQVEAYIKPDEELIKKTLRTFIGKTKVAYPLFSSKPYKGKALFDHGKDNSILSEEIPHTYLDIDDIKLIEITHKSSAQLEKEIYEKIDSVKGDFRQEAIKKNWNGFFQNQKEQSFMLFNINVKCKSGSYMRTLAYEFGKKIGVPCLAFHIKRTKVGEFGVEKSLKF